MKQYVIQSQTMDKEENQNTEQTKKPFYKPSDAFISSARENMTYYLVTAFGIVVAFAWNDAFKSLIKEYFPVAENGVWPQFLYATIITIILVIVSALAFEYLGQRKEKEKSDRT